MGLGMFGVDLEGMTSDLPPPLPPALRLDGALWLVVGQTGPLSLSDSALLEQLSWLGAEVHTVRDAEFAVQPATRRWPGVHAAVISASVREGFLRGSPLVGVQEHRRRAERGDPPPGDHQGQGRGGQAKVARRRRRRCASPSRGTAATASSLVSR